MIVQTKEIVQPDSHILFCGAHRGLDAATSALLDPSLALKPANVTVVDPAFGRAEEMAARWEDAGHRVRAVAADARSIVVPSNTDVLGLCMDNAAAQSELLHKSSARMVTGGNVVSIDYGDGGGLVAAIGLTCPRTDTKSWEDAKILMHCLASMTGDERVSSRAVTSPLFNMPQAGVVRTTLYRKIASDTYEFLTRRKEQGSLYVCIALPRPATYRLSLVPRQGRSRREMKTFAEGAATTSPEKSGIAFFDSERPAWLYVVLPVRRNRSFTIELPRPTIQTARPSQAMLRTALATGRIETTRTVATRGASTFNLTD